MELESIPGLGCKLSAVMLNEVIDASGYSRMAQFQKNLTPLWSSWPNTCALPFFTSTLSARCKTSLSSPWKASSVSILALYIKVLKNIDNLPCEAVASPSDNS